MKADSLKLPYGCPPGLRHSFLHLLGVLSQLGPSLRTALSRWSCGARSSNRPWGVVSSQWLVHLVEQKLTPFTFKEPSQLQSPRGLPRGSCCTCITVCSPSANPAPLTALQGWFGRRLSQPTARESPFQRLFLGNLDDHRPTASNQVFPCCPVTQNASSFFLTIWH